MDFAGERLAVLRGLWSKKLERGSSKSVFEP
jgi:hypothetical protein